MFSIRTSISHGVTYAAVLMAAAGAGGGGFVRGSSVTEHLPLFGDGSEQQRVLLAKNSKKTAAPPQCNEELFKGTWTYKNCDSDTIDFTMGCTGNSDTCSYRENNLVEDGVSCPLGGPFQDNKGSNISYNDSTGWCEIEYFDFTEDPCGISPSLGMKAYISMNENGAGHPATMHLLFSIDGGESFYNADGDVRVATRIWSSDRRRDRRRDLIVEEKEEQLETSPSWSSVATDSTELQRRRLGCVPECTLECKEEKDGQKKLGRDCCKDQGQSEEKCYLNSGTSTCKCRNEGHCYIEMRCKDHETWQGNECRVKPEIPECTSQCKGEKDAQKKAGKECCADQGQSEETCILNSNGSTCNCSDRVKCYIDMRCDDNETLQDNECRVKPGVPECSLACKKEKRECCRKQGQSGKKCILNSDSSTCKCSSEKDPCYIEMRCNYADTWQDGKCFRKPWQSCLDYTDATKCTDGFYCNSKESVCFALDYYDRRCGTNFTVANNNCGLQCNRNYDCPDGEDCYGWVKRCDRIKGVPECSLECKGEKDEKGNDRRACCTDQGQSEQCYLNSGTSTCNCPNVRDEGYCYIEMRCEDHQTWQRIGAIFDKYNEGCEGACLSKPDQKCVEKYNKGGLMQISCTYGYECRNEKCVSVDAA